MKPMLSPKEVAAAIGVSESSLKRWADDGRLRVSRTVGGHRRISLQEAVRFARQANLPVLKPEIFGLPELALARRSRGGKGDAVELLTDRLSSGQADEARAIILDLYLSGRSVGYICDEPIRRAMQSIGETWKHQANGIALEHRATDICIHSLNLLRHLIERPRSKPTDRADGGGDADPLPAAVGGAPSGDPYLLPSIMSACVFAEAGFHAINLGPDTPLQTLALSAETCRAHAVWLSCSVDEQPPSRGEFEALCSRVAEINGRVVLGGRALTPPMIDAPNLHVFATMSELSGFAKGLTTSHHGRDATETASNSG